MHRSLAAMALAMTLTPTLFAQGRDIEILGAPVPAKSVTIRLINPATSSGDPFFLAVSPHSDNKTTFPATTGITGDFLLHPTAWLVLGGGTLAATPTDLGPIPIANDPNLIGAQADLQYLDVTSASTGTLSDEAVVTLHTGVGTTALAIGSTSSTIGWQISRVQNASAGKPVNQGIKYDSETGMRYNGQRGWVQGYYQTFSATPYNTDPDRFVAGKSGRDMLDPRFQSLYLANGKFFSIARDPSKPKEFAAIAIDNKTGVMIEVSGSRVLSPSTSTAPSNMYGDYWTMSKDGNVVAGIIDGFASGTTKDELVLMRTDGKTWAAATGSALPGSNTSTLRVTHSTAAATFSAFDGYVTVVTTATGEEVAMYGSSSGILWAPMDGKSLATLAGIPNSGTGKPARSLFGNSHRVGGDTVAYPFGYATSSTVEHDVIAYKASKTGSTISVTATNFTKWTVATTIERFFGANRNADTSMLADMSRDGKVMAILGGAGGTTNPNKLYAVKTDGTTTNPTAIAGFPATAVWMGTPHILPNGDILVFAGAGTTTFDLYKVASPFAATPSVTKLTSTANINVAWTLVSDNGLYFYFGRDYSSSTVSLALNIVGVGPTGALFNVTGKEFTGASTIDMGLSTSHYANAFRKNPDGMGDMHFIGRQVHETSPATKYYDQNIWKWNFEAGGVAKKVTNYTGSGTTSSTSTIFIEGPVPLKNGSVVYAASKGTASTSTGRAQRVNVHKGDGISAAVTIGDDVFGAYVMDGRLRVIESLGVAVWVQANSTSTSANNQRAYYAKLDNSMHGHPMALSGPAIAGSSGNVVILTTGIDNP